MDDLFITCPHCGGLIQIIQINCRIFRHGVYITTGNQIHPHLPKSDCEQLVACNKIYGCGKPFELIDQNNTKVAVACEYK